MNHAATKNLAYLLGATLGSFVFWGALDQKLMRPGEPHPTLKDGALKSALQKDWKKDHAEIGYIQARSALFSNIDGDGRSAECRYTGEEIKYMAQPLPNKGAVEHAWPLTRLPSEARADLHHMYITIPEARVARANLRYGDVLVAVWKQGGSRSGPSKRVVPVFEVRPEQRGDVARAVFYVATMYELEIPDAEEKILRDWSKKDRVSKEEKLRNQKVAAKQGSRNPYVDYPNMVNRIKNF